MNTWGYFSFFFFLAKDTVSLAALRNPQFFNTDVPVTINLRFVLKKTLEVNSIFMNKTRLLVIPWHLSMKRSFSKKQDKCKDKYHWSLRLKIFKILNQALQFSDVASGIMHLISFPKRSYLTLFPSKLFSPVLSPPFHDWYHPFSSPFGNCHFLQLHIIVRASSVTYS